MYNKLLNVQQGRQPTLWLLVFLLRQRDTVVDGERKEEKKSSLLAPFRPRHMLHLVYISTIYRWADDVLLLRWSFVDRYAVHSDFLLHLFDSNEMNFSFSNVGKMYFKSTMGF